MVNVLGLSVKEERKHWVPRNFLADNGSGRISSEQTVKQRKDAFPMKAGGHQSLYTSLSSPRSFIPDPHIVGPFPHKDKKALSSQQYQ